MPPCGHHSGPCSGAFFSRSLTTSRACAFCRAILSFCSHPALYPPAYAPAGVRRLLLNLLHPAGCSCCSCCFCRLLIFRAALARCGRVARDLGALMDRAAEVDRVFAEAVAQQRRSTGGDTGEIWERPQAPPGAGGEARPSQAYEDPLLARFRALEDEGQ